MSIASFFSFTHTFLDDGPALFGGKKKIPTFNFFFQKNFHLNENFSLELAKFGG
jgi:hypothetical protein